MFYSQIPGTLQADRERKTIIDTQWGKQLYRF